MSLFVDHSVWFHRDLLWCHMVSDVSYEELHSFAEQLGIPRRAFHGDHYDLRDESRAIAVARGAVEVTSRDVLMILRTSGLRMSPQQRRMLTW